MDGDRLQAVLARCRRIQGGAETLTNLPPQLAERLKTLYAKCERLKQAKQKSGSPAVSAEEESDSEEEEEEVDKAEASVPSKSDEALLGRDGWDGEAEDLDNRQSEQDDDAATFDPYLVPDDCEAEEAKEEANAEDSATEPSDDEDCDWTDLPTGTTFDAEGASYTVARKLGQSLGIITYAVNCRGENFVAKLSADGQALARRRPGSDNKVTLQNVSVDVFDVSSFVKTLAEVMADFGVSQLSAPVMPAPTAKQPEEPGPPMLVPTEEAPKPEAATFKRLFHQPEEAAPKVKTLFGEAAEVQPKRQISLDKSCFKVLFREPAEISPDPGQAPELLAPAFAKVPSVAMPPEKRVQESSPPDAGQAPSTGSNAWYKVGRLDVQRAQLANAPPPKKTLSSMLSSYEDEEGPPAREVDRTREADRVRLTSEAARERAAQRRGRVSNQADEGPSTEDPVRAVGTASNAGHFAPGSVWDPATGQFVSEPIPEDILQAFKREKDFNLEDYQQRVLMAQLAEKKRRLEQEAERRVKLKVEEERAAERERQRQQQERQRQQQERFQQLLLLQQQQQQQQEEQEQQIPGQQQQQQQQQQQHPLPQEGAPVGALVAYAEPAEVSPDSPRIVPPRQLEDSPPANPESPELGPETSEVQVPIQSLEVALQPGCVPLAPAPQFSLIDQAPNQQLLNVQLQAQQLQMQHLQMQQLQAQQLATLQQLLDLYGRMAGPYQHAEPQPAAPPALLDPQQLAMHQHMQLAAQIHAWMSAGQSMPML